MISDAQVEPMVGCKRNLDLENYLFSWFLCFCFSCSMYVKGKKSQRGKMYMFRSNQFITYRSDATSEAKRADMVSSWATFTRDIMWFHGNDNMDLVPRKLL